MDFDITSYQLNVREIHVWVIIIIFGQEEYHIFEAVCFSKQSSTDGAFVENTEKLRKGSTATFTCVWIDLRKAFDSKIHEILSSKLAKNGVRGVCLGC